MLRDAIRDEYAAVAKNPDGGFHFHTGRALTRIVGYESEWLEGIPDTAVPRLPAPAIPLAWVCSRPVGESLTWAVALESTV